MCWVGVDLSLGFSTHPEHVTQELRIPDVFFLSKL